MTHILKRTKHVLLPTDIHSNDIPLQQIMQKMGVVVENPKPVKLVDPFGEPLNKKS